MCWVHGAGWGRNWWILSWEVEDMSQRRSGLSWMLKGGEKCSRGRNWEGCARLRTLVLCQGRKKGRKMTRSICCDWWAGDEAKQVYGGTASLPRAPPGAHLWVLWRFPPGPLLSQRRFRIFPIPSSHPSVLPKLFRTYSISISTK